MIATTVRLSEELHTRLKIAAAERKLKMQNLIKLALENELERESSDTNHAAIPSSQASSPQVPTVTVPRDLQSLIASLVSDQSGAGAFVQALPFPIVVKDRDSRVVWCNRQFEILADGQLEELKGMTSQEIFGLPEKNPLAEAERRVVATGQPQQSVEIVPPNRVRQTLRFGICDPSGAVYRIGVIAIDFDFALRPSLPTRTGHGSAGPTPGAVPPLENVVSPEEQRKLRAL